MPMTVLGLVQAASMTRFMRAAVLDVIRLDYVNTARAKGLSEGVTLVKHVVRNALIPVVTLVAIQIPNIFGGAIVTEQIFRVPGIGSLLIASILANDTPVVMAVTFVFSILVLLSSLRRGPHLRVARPAHLVPLMARVASDTVLAKLAVAAAAAANLLWHEARRRFRRHRLAMVGA